MQYGKKICELLKDIRKQIADDNGIEYTPASCEHEGDCPGTCPQCDKELKELQDILDKKVADKEPVIIHKTDKSLSYEFEAPRVLGGCPVARPIEGFAGGNFSNDDEDLPF